MPVDTASQVEGRRRCPAQLKEVVSALSWTTEGAEQAHARLQLVALTEATTGIFDDYSTVTGRCMLLHQHSLERHFI